MDKKKAKTDKKRSKPSKYLLQMTRKGVFLGSSLVVLISAWMFVLGVLVGRGTAPVQFDIGELQQELIALKESIIAQEQERTRAETPSLEEKEDLEFYEALKGSAKDENLVIRKRKKSPAASADNQKGPQAEKASKKPLTSMKKKTRSGSAPAVKGDFYVQVASTRNADAADELVKKLKGKGYSSYKTKVEITGKGTWYRVCAGGFTSQAEAANTRDKLTALGYQGMVKKN